MNRYKATLSTGHVLTRTSRTRTYSHAWALIAETGAVLLSGFARTEALAHAAKATNEKQHTEKRAQWQAGTHPAQKLSGPDYLSQLAKFYEHAAHAEVVAVEAL